MSHILRLSSRKSALAKLQTYLIAQAIKQNFPNIQLEYIFKESTGDKDLTSPLWKMPERGVFTRDFKEDLLNGNVDAVVHSYKDLETTEDDQTRILSVLSRADQRDLLLFKKSAFLEPNFDTIKLMSSSPRREYNLSPFLQKAFPKRLSNKPIVFEPVRGNIQTRINKWLDSKDIQGIILAKAAIDRLLSKDFPESYNPEYVEIHDFLRKILKDCLFMCLPLTENPNAPAQGGIAVEIKSNNERVIDLFSKLIVVPTSNAIIRERQKLKQYGGGCHQKIGVAILKRNFGTIQIIKGLTDAGEILNKVHLENDIDMEKAKSLDNIFPYKEKILKFKRTSFYTDQTPDRDIWVARKDSWMDHWTQKNLDKIIWAAGLRTWYELAQKDIWVFGSSEGLGEDESPNIDTILNRKADFVKITHSHSSEVDSNFDRIPTYSLELESDIIDVSNVTHFFWMSGHQFDLMLQRYPSIKDKHHSCGPGITHQHILKRLGMNTKVTVFLNYQNWLDIHSKQ